MSFQMRMVTNQLLDLRRGIEKDLSEVVEAAARMMVEEAQALVPVDTGSLKASIRAEKAAQFRWVVSAGGPAPGQVNDPVEYAELVENGTVGRPGTPYFTPAADMARLRFGPRVKIAVSQAPRKYVR